MKFDELDLLKIGNTIQIVGSIWQGEGMVLSCYFPGEKPEQGDGLTDMEMSLEEWEHFLRQSDLLETEILAQKKGNRDLVQAVVRKGSRQIDQRVSWAVYKRDGYACRWCGTDDGPLTVDHLVLWEEGGPSIKSNLVSSCKRCNRTRGNMQLADGLESPEYKHRSRNLTDFDKVRNHRLLDVLDSIPRRVHRISR